MAKRKTSIFIGKKRDYILFSLIKLKILYNLQLK
jgi:hypothetical protein